MRSLFRILMALFLCVCAFAQSGTSILTNKSGGALNKYDVVVVDSSNNLAFKTTTTSRAANVIGVVFDTTVSNNATGKVALPGQVMYVRVQGLVTRGDYLVTSTTAGAAASGGTTDISGAFGIALETGTTTNIRAYIFTPMLQGTASDLSVGAITATGAYTGTVEDAGTNTVISLASLFHKSSGTPASGLGAKIRLGAEDSAGNSEVAAELHGYLTTVTNSSEVGAFLLRLISAGSLTDVLTITPTMLTAAGDVTITGNDIATPGDLTITPSGGDVFLASSTLDVSGFVAFGGTASVSAFNIVSAYNNFTNTTAVTVSAFDTITGLAAAATSSASYNPIRAVSYVGTAQSYTGTVRGGLFQIDMAAAATLTTGNVVTATVAKTAGTITTLKLFYADVSGSSTTVTTGYAFYGENTGAGTNAYGYYQEDVNSGGTLNYAIYTNAGDVRFGDRLLLNVNTTFSANDTTPTVAAGNVFTVPGTWTAGNNITAFDDGVLGQEIIIIGGDSDCVVNDASTLVLNGAWTAAANATLRLVYNGSSWFELSRSAN